MVGCGKLLPFLIFAGNTSIFCWNQFLDLLQQERIVLGGHDGRGAMFFAARDFCWNQLFDLLQLPRMVLERLRWRRHDFFCCIVFFVGNPLFNFLLELHVFFVGIMFVFLLEPYQCVLLKS